MEVKLHIKILLKNTEGKLLLIKRTEGNKTRDVPGGALNYPETIEEGMLREIKEETGITHIHSLQVVEAISSYNKDTDEYVVFLWYIWTTPEHAVHLSDEHEEFRRASKEEALEIGLTHYLIDFISKS